jgi:hypothetical protein
MEYYESLKHSIQKYSSSVSSLFFIFFVCAFLCTSHAILSSYFQLQSRYFTLEENFLKWWKDLWRRFSSFEQIIRYV